MNTKKIKRALPSNASLPPVAMQLQSWSSGIPSETRFWKEWIATQGGQWPQDFIDRLDPVRPMDAPHAKLVRSLGKKKVDILDVGAGPFTWLGKTVSGIIVNLRACDPLSEVYNRLLAEHNVMPPVVTEFAPVEDLLWSYKPASFDIVHIRNALDHSFEPLRGIMQMLALCRPGGYVVLSHFSNEAEREAYEGFHQWNFDKVNGKFTVWNKSEKIRVADHTGAYARETSTLKEATADQIGWIEVVYKRNARKMPKVAPAEAIARASDILKFFISHASALGPH